MSEHKTCISCSTSEVETILNLGLQPPSNRFLQSPDELQERHTLVLGQCKFCAHLQLIDPMPLEMVRTRFDWLVYNEPEGHLDQVVEEFRGLPGIGPHSLIFGLTYKDDSTMERLNRFGYKRTYRFDAASDLGITNRCAGLESTQAAVTPSIISQLSNKQGPAAILFARHILEHAHDPVSFVESLSGLLEPDGYLVFEVPDSEKFIEACDYPFLWEEHISYFTSETLEAFVRRCGFEVVRLLRYSYPFEDSLVVIARHVGRSSVEAPSNTDWITQGLQTGKAFGARFREVCDHYRDALHELRGTGKRIAVFGAGHLAAKFINFFELEALTDCVIDDHPHKQGLHIPGSGLKVIGSSALQEIDVCLLSLNPESEEKILAKNQAFVERGGEFRSIFALSPIGLRSIVSQQN